MDLFSEYISLENALNCINFEGLIYLILAFILLWLGKLSNDLVTSYDIDKELTQKDNKALAVSYVGYLIAQGIIILGVISGPDEYSLLLELGLVALWSIIGIALLNLARIVNDKLIFSKFCNKKEIIEDRNVGTGAVQFGSYVGTAFLVKAIVSSESAGLVRDIIGTVIFFIIGQIGFILFSIIYQKITKYDLHDEIEKDNIAAGVSFGATLVAIGIIMSHSIEITDSIPSFIVWFVNGVILITASRFIIDKVILPKHKLDEEISQDRNWGVSLIEGGSAIIIALLLNSSFA
ncbi:MAG: DUF350 domain-containing protein [Chitinispirillia bacterium]|jgi:uncharacterized membrane protein YjfL (UPF0719 family)